MLMSRVAVNTASPNNIWEQMQKEKVILLPQEDVYVCAQQPHSVDVCEDKIYEE